MTNRLYEVAVRAQQLAIDGASRIAKERSEHFSKHKITIEMDAKENSDFQLAEAATILLNQKFKSSRMTIPPDGWDEEKFERILKKPYEQRLIIAGSFIAAEYDRIRFGAEPSEIINHSNSPEY